MNSETNPPPSSRRMHWLPIGIMIGLLVVAVGIVAIRPQLQTLPLLPTPPSQSIATFAPDVFGIIPLNPPVALQDFTLPAALPGGTVGDLNLSEFRQNGSFYTLMFFGYTHCPDFCPTTLSEFVRIKTQLGDAADNINFLFISVDGERDTPEVMRTYLDRFDAAFYGMSGDAETLTRIAADYGLDYELRTDEGRGDNYLVDHTTMSYLIDPAMQLAAIYDYNALPNDIAADIAARL